MYPNNKTGGEMEDKLLIFKEVSESAIIRGEYMGLTFNLVFLGFQLGECKSFFELTLYLNDDDFELSKRFEENYVLKQFDNLNNFFVLEIPKMTKEIVDKTKF